LLIGQLSRESNVSVRSIRYYESKGLVQSQRLANGYRHYQADAVAGVRIIKTCLGLGFSVKELASILGCRAAGEEPLPRCDKAMEMYSQRLQDVEEQIANLSLVRELLQATISEPAV